MNCNIILGKRYKDKVSGFVGIATSKHEYLNGCIRISLTPTVDKDNKPQDPQSYDYQELELVDDGVQVVEPEKRNGGPQRDNAPHR